MSLFNATKLFTISLLALALLSGCQYFTNDAVSELKINLEENSEQEVQGAAAQVPDSNSQPVDGAVVQEFEPGQAVETSGGDVGATGAPIQIFYSMF